MSAPPMRVDGSTTKVSAVRRPSESASTPVSTAPRNPPNTVTYTPTIVAPRERNRYGMTEFATATMLLNAASDRALPMATKTPSSHTVGMYSPTAMKTPNAAVSTPTNTNDAGGLRRKSASVRGAAIASAAMPGTATSEP